MQTTINRSQLFLASCLALLVTSLSFGIRAGLLNTWGHDFALKQEEIGIITSTAFWGFPLAIIIGGMVVSTVLNLFFIPALYVILESALSRFKRKPRVKRQLQVAQEQ